MKLALALLLTQAGCTSTASAPDAEPRDAGAIYEGGGACMADVESHPEEGASHVAACTPVSYGTSPPSSGNHYPVWAAYRVYDAPVPHGFTVHDLEHGAIVVSYNCPDGCPDDVARLVAWANSPPPDVDCAGAPVHHRLLVTPDPTLDVPFAAASWQFTMRASCFDEESCSRFYRDHIGHGREVVCGDGVDIASIQGGVTSCLP